MIDVNIQHNTLEKWIADYLKPILNHIDPNPNVTDINTRIENVWKTNCYLSLPNILMFRLKRWQRGYNRAKNNKRVSFPLQGLNMNPYVYKYGGETNAQNSRYVHHTREGPYIYDLRFIIIHSGTTTNGHYKCFTMDCNGKCGIFSDR
eukprot:87012_1